LFLAAIWKASIVVALQDMPAVILVQPLDKELGPKDNAMPFQPCSKQLEKWFHTSKSL
jgi:hypothetical protein